MILTEFVKNRNQRGHSRGKQLRKQTRKCEKVKHNFRSLSYRSSINPLYDPAGLRPTYPRKR